ncbi:major histocompatibility complex class I-related gene protein-like [Bombina bombina]|uniref:major histocompatibility complex class I-related gene protein-like n=1 Tax=Bombina bombina TaxID=8345 RepID=UPI00235AB4F7|nr:major histocompatibility complex class I-related gene protein-like [Bombina bombina]
MRLLFLLSLLVPDAACDSHRLQYFVTTAPVPIPGLPKYSIIGYIDDMPYAKYTSETERAEIFYKWLDEKTDPEHWKEMTQRAQNFERYHRDITRLIRVLFNQTTDKHILQVKLECELHDDGTINGGLEFGYDGEEIIAFDKERVIFIPMHQEAQYITQKWNIDGMIRNKDLIERDCIRWIKMYFRLGQNKLERKVPPKVEIFDHQSDTATKLHCLAYGFYPRAVDAKWVKNSKDDVYSDVAKQILPNPDGTYQIRVTVEVIPKNEDTYGCHIDHSSLNNPMIVLWVTVLFPFEKRTFLRNSAQRQRFPLGQSNPRVLGSWLNPGLSPSRARSPPIPSRHGGMAPNPFLDGTIKKGFLSGLCVGYVLPRTHCPTSYCRERLDKPSFGPRRGKEPSVLFWTYSDLATFLTVTSFEMETDGLEKGISANFLRGLISALSVLQHKRIAELPDVQFFV